MRKEELEHRIINCTSEEAFEALAIEVFYFQYEHCSVYREFCNALNKKHPTSLLEIPHLPISFFKTHEVVQQHVENEVLFLSSGTGSMERSKHYVPYPFLYERSFLETYKQQIGNPNEQIIVALLPNYITQGHSSLVYMVDYLIKQTNHALSGFYLDDLQGLKRIIKEANLTGKEVVLFGVSYALLDFCERSPDCSNVTVIETGGMKGRRKELIKEELHAILKKGLNAKRISSEYGMTELLSQAYLNKEGWFKCPSWMRILVRDLNDPLSYLKLHKTGAVNVIDLANLYTCSFIATDDLGVLSEDGFKILGRVDYSDIRGCNLLVS